MSESNVTYQARQAERELGTTLLERPVAWLLVLVFLGSIGAVPIVDSWVDESPLPALGELPSAVVETSRITWTEGPLAGNRSLQESLDRTEGRLEEQSFLRAWLLPRVQVRLLEWLGLGNEQVYPGLDGWLFYRADIDHLTGPGFLEPRVLRERRQGGEAWEAPPQPDPVRALIGFERRLAARGIDLILMPTPVKPAVHPERFTRRAPAKGSSDMRNRSYGDFLDRLRAAGLNVFDPRATLLEAARSSEEAAYLRTDTHWTPAAMDAVARALASRLLAEYDLGPEVPAWFDRAVAVQAEGDLTAMLRLPETQRLVPPQAVTIRPVVDAAGSSWRPRRGAPVLLLGDSFTNVFSDPRLGWGAAAGLAERLSFHLRRPLDRIAVNAGGAHASREALARDLLQGQDRLAGTRVTIYQFAARELSQGDWRELRDAP